MEIRYATARDGVRIGFWTIGRGDPLVVMPEPILGSIEADALLPSPRSWYERLSRRRLVIRFDHRGSGVSQRHRPAVSLEDLQLDLEAVVDELRLQSFNLWGQEDAGLIAIAFAAGHPDRVKNLILWNTWARAADIAESPALKALETVIDKAWRLWVESCVQSIWAWKGPEAVQYAHALIDVVPRESWANFASTAWSWDVTNLLPLLRCPTLVIHRRDQPFFPLRLGVALARDIKGARLAVVDGESQLPWAGDSESCASILDGFLGDSVSERTPVGRRAPQARRVLATVLFTDVVGSTQKIAEFGDRRWREILQTHQGMVRKDLSRFGGREIKTIGDGFLATFGRPERAVNCALAITRTAATLGLQIRAGVHMGELEMAGADVHGMAVNIAARVAALAAPGEVLVTRTVAEVTTGSGIEFIDRGEQELRGVPGRWGLSAVKS